MPVSFGNYLTLTDAVRRIGVSAIDVQQLTTDRSVATNVTAWDRADSARMRLKHWLIGGRLTAFGQDDEGAYTALGPDRLEDRRVVSGQQLVGNDQNFRLFGGLLEQQPDVGLPLIAELQSRHIRPLDIYGLSEDVGRWIGRSGRDLVSGAGLLVGSAAISGFLEALRDGGGWDLNRRLIARPFPQPLAGAEPNAAKWTELRKELARQAGGIIFIGGIKQEGDKLVPAGGVLEEYEAAREVGAFLLPIGATGGAAQEIAEKLIGSDVEATGPKAMRPTDDELKILLDPATERQAVLECIDAVVTRLTK